MKRILSEIPYQKKKYVLFVKPFRFRVREATYVGVAFIDKEETLHIDSVLEYGDKTIAALLYSLPDLNKALKRYTYTRVWEVLLSKSGNKPEVRTARDLYVLYQSAIRLHDIAIKNFYLDLISGLEKSFIEYFTLFLKSFTDLYTYIHSDEDIDIEEEEEEKETLNDDEKEKIGFIPKLENFYLIKDLANKLVESVFLGNKILNIDFFLQKMRELQDNIIELNVHMDIATLEKFLEDLF